MSNYFFIPIIWVSQRHLLRFTDSATPQLTWWNFAHLFMVSLVPAATIWIAAARFAAAPVFVYALVFVLIETAYIAFEGEALAQVSGSDMTPPLRRITKIRSYMALGMFSTAAAISFLSPLSGFALVCCVVFIYLSPRVPDLLHKPARS